MGIVFDENLDHVLLREKRFRMVEHQIRLRSIFDKRVLENMKKVPRHLFVQDKYWEVAYGDHPIPIGCGQSSSQPYMIGLMMQALELRPLHKVLEIGTGSGYQTSLLAEVASKVFTIENDEKLFNLSKTRLKSFGYGNIEHTRPKVQIGWKSKGPFDRIIVNGVLKCPPKELIGQMSSKSIMVVPIGTKYGKQTIYKISKNNDEISMWKIAEVKSLCMIDGHKVTPHA